MGVVFLCLFLTMHTSGCSQLLIPISYLGSIIKGVSPALNHYDQYW